MSVAATTPAPRTAAAAVSALTSALASKLAAGRKSTEEL